MTSEDEQIKQLKKWWDDNGLFTVGSLVIVVSLVLGWQGWQQQRQAKLDGAAYAYDQLLDAVEKSLTNPGDDIVVAQATHLANQMKENFKDSGFAAFAALFNARQAIADEDYAVAEQELRWVLEQSKSVELSHIASLRLARLFYAQEQYQQAIALIPEGSGNSFDPLFNELRGDILLAQEQYQPARDAYLAAKSAVEQLQADAPPLLDTKLQYVSSFL